MMQSLACHQYSKKFLNLFNAHAILASMKCSSPATADGFTIIEVFLVLAATSALFLMAVLSFTGRIGQVQLMQSTRDLESKLQTIANEVSSGYYPNTQLTCTGSNSGAAVVIVSAGGKPGHNINCIFLGKVAAFTDTDTVNILSLAGRQYVGVIGSATVASLSKAKPQVVEVTPDSYNYQVGLKPTAIYDNSDPTTNAHQYGAIAFISQLGDSTGNPLTGSRTVLLYGVAGSTFTNSISDIANNVNTSYANLVLLDKGARLCFIGGNGKRSEITIGSSGDQMSTSVLIGGGVSSECPA